MDTLQAIKDRTSYRGLYKNSPVPRNDLRSIMEAGLAAPSGCNRQTTRLAAVDEPDLLQKIQAIIGMKHSSSAPALICVFTKKEICYRGMSFHIQDYAAAIENMLLAAVALGYQSCWIEGQVTDDDHKARQIAEFLNAPEDYNLVCILPVGVAADPVKRPVKKDFAERAQFNGFPD